MHIPPASFRVTPYGEVDAQALKALREHYDTASLLGMVDALDKCLARVGGIDRLRDELIRLHAMAHTAINGAPLSVLPETTGSIWENADAILMDLEALNDWIIAVRDTVSPLAGLSPGHDG
ncbi:Tn3 family transposase post-transcriptional regulator TnpC [Pseudomonas cavernicola]|nr:Tn3 family transposase post-transcriptional regulator TnpC [Pseudomonas cavernicola]